MLSAAAVSVAFLVSYLTYHYQVGDVRFQGHGWIRPTYFTILITHITLAAAIVPLVLVTLGAHCAAIFASIGESRDGRGRYGFTSRSPG